MWADDHIVQVGSLQQVIEERPGVGDLGVLSKDSWIRDKTISPAHLDWVLGHAFYEEQCRGTELQVA